jgi:hypothetical protein
MRERLPARRVDAVLILDRRAALVLLVGLVLLVQVWFAHYAMTRPNTVPDDLDCSGHITQQPRACYH